MNKFENFWIVTVLRGVLALLVGSAILVVPDMARTLLFLPFAVTVVILSFAVYGTIDSVLVFMTSFFTSLRPAKVGLRLQSVCGVILGALFCSILFERMQLGWFLYLISLQAFATACSEYAIARHTSRKHGSRWSYGTSGTALLCAAGYMIAAKIAPDALSPRDIALLAYAYLAVFGVAQCLMATRMLYLEHHEPRMAHAVTP